MSAFLLTSSLLEKIKAKAQDLGFDQIGFSSAVVAEKDQESYEAWRKAGHGARMDFLTLDPDQRKDIRRIFPEAKSVISLGVGYFQGVVPSKPGSNFGRVARYAWGLDYHEVVLKKIQELISFLRSKLGLQSKMMGGVDSISVLEKSLARSAGLGFCGKNSVLISHFGSWLFLSEIILGESLPQDVEALSSMRNCGECTRCIKGCPTGALREPYNLNTGRCISYLTVENRGWIPREFREKMGDWLFGCDLCQDVCPFNSAAVLTRCLEFGPDKGTGAWIKLEEILSIPDQRSFEKKLAGTALLRSKRKGLLRNACVVAGNSKDEGLIAPLKKLLEDPNPIIRGHAVWALGELAGPSEARSLAETQLKIEKDPQVIEECKVLLCGNE